MSSIPIRLRRTTETAEPLRFTFTVAQLDRLRAVASRTWAYDRKQDGLAFQVTPTGQRAFYFVSRCDGRYRKMKLGDFPSVTIEQARKVAKRHHGTIATGGNPFDDRKVVRDSATLGEVFDVYMEQYARTKTRQTTAREYERQYRAHLAPWARRRLNQITGAEVETLHNRIGAGDDGSPFMANRVLALISGVYTFAKQKDINPARGIERFPEPSRSRWLGREGGELARFLAAVEQHDDADMKDFFKVLLFTAQRRGNVQSMTWAELDFDRGVWSIPAGKYKAGHGLDVPLPRPVADILKARRKVDPKGEYVFPARRTDSATPHMTEPKIAFANVCKRGGLKAVRMHDMRRTFASWATELGQPWPIIHHVMLGHNARNVSEVYARYGADAVRRAFDATVAAMTATGDGKRVKGKKKKK